MYAQFLVVAVRSWSLLQYEVFYSPLLKVNIEGTGAPTPMYYGWETSYVVCHDQISTFMQNFLPQRNSRVKAKYSEEYDECVRTDNAAMKLGKGNVCPPGPVTCSISAGEKDKTKPKPPQTASQWKRFRRNYLVQHNKEIGTDLFCYYCGTYRSQIGEGDWKIPVVGISKEGEVDIIEVITKKTILVKPNFPGIKCEKRDSYGKNENGSRDISLDKKGCEIDFGTRLINAGYRWGQRSLKFHALIMIFAFTVGTNCLVYSARFLKEAHIIEKGSSCWGIGVWLWDHMGWSYATGAAMWAGFTMYAFQKLTVVCKLYDEREHTEHCEKYGYIHKVIGGCAGLIFHMSYITGWARPQQAGTRNVVIVYHIVTGYLAKYLGLLSLFLVPPGFDTLSIGLIVMLEVDFWVIFTVGSFVQRSIDSTLHNLGRKMLPVPEGIDTHAEIPLEKLRVLLLPILTLSQIALFGGLCLHTLTSFTKKYS